MSITFMNSLNSSYIGSVDNVQRNDIIEKVSLIGCIWILLFISIIYGYRAYFRSQPSRKTYFIDIYILVINIISSGLCSLVIPMNLLYHIPVGFLGPIGYNITNMLEIFSVSLLFNTTALMVMERYLTVKNQVSRVGTIDQVKAKIYIACTWGIVNVSAVVFNQTCFNQYKCVHGLNALDDCLNNCHYYNIFLNVSIFVAPLCIIAYCSTQILRTCSTASAIFFKRRKNHQEFLSKLYFQVVAYIFLNVPRYVLFTNVVSKNFQGSITRMLLIHFQILSWISYLIHPIIYYDTVNVFSKCWSNKERRDKPKQDQISFDVLKAVSKASINTNSSTSMRSESQLSVLEYPYLISAVKSDQFTPTSSDGVSTKAKNISRKLTKRFSIFQNYRNSYIETIFNEEDLFNPYIYDLLLHAFREQQEKR